MTLVREDPSKALSAMASPSEARTSGASAVGAGPARARHAELPGDAAGLADPATGEEIHNALRSAEFLAESLARDSSFEACPAIAAARLEPARLSTTGMGPRRPIGGRALLRVGMAGGEEQRP